MAILKSGVQQRYEYERELIDEVWNDRHFDLFDATTSEDYVGHWFGLEKEELDRDGYRAFIESVHEAFSDFEMEPEFVVGDEEMVTVGFTASGTHDGEFMGIPATGKHGTIRGILVHRFDEDGMVVEGWAVWDALDLLQQLGVVPETFTLSAFLETGANLAKQGVLKRARDR